MSFEAGKALAVDQQQVTVLSRAMRRTGRPVVLVPLGEGLHAGHVALIRTARRIPRAVVIVAWSGEEVPAAFAEEKVDAVWRYRSEQLWPKGLRTLIQPMDLDLEPVADIAQALTLQLSLINAVAPSDLVCGEKDYQQLRSLQHALTDLHLPVTLHGVPTVRMPNGLAISLRNERVAVAERDKALVLAAALTAGAHSAEHGAEAVLAITRQVLDTAQITPEYLQLRSLDLGPAPEIGDARLLVAAEIGGVRLTDSVGLPLGIGFRNLEQGQVEQLN